MIRFPRYVETLAWAAFYIACVIFAVTADSSPPEYRAVFIEHTAADWVLNASHDYVPGRPIPVSEPSPFFAKGWWRPEPDGRWGKGRLNTIILRPTSDLPSGSKIAGRADALIGGDQPNQVIAIRINGNEVGRLTFDVRRRSQEMKLPLPTAIAAGSQVEIAFEATYVATPLELGVDQDSRELGVRLQALTLLPPA
jgi:hypothetical protein